jgi:halocyanin-like protein
MTDRNEDVSRRGFLQAAAGGAGVAAASGTAVAQEEGNESDGEGGENGDGGGGGGQPDFGGHLDDANLYDGSVADMTGQDTVTVSVGAGDQSYGFDPPAVHVDNGATVQWEWTGNGGNHNVQSADDGPLDSGSAVGGEGVQYEHTFEEDGIYNYVCVPHEGLGMLGSVVVGTDYPTVDTGGGGEAAGPILPNSAKTIGVATATVMVATLGLVYFFMKYGGDYEATEY